jgi:hypothetical protein
MIGALSPIFRFAKFWMRGIENIRRGGITIFKDLDVTATPRISACVSSRLPLITGPGPRVVEKIIVDMIEHAVRAQVNEHHAGNLPDNQQSLRIPAACEASVRQILFVKLITLFIVVFH